MFTILCSLLLSICAINTIGIETPFCHFEQQNKFIRLNLNNYHLLFRRESDTMLSAIFLVENKSFLKGNIYYIPTKITTYTAYLFSHYLEPPVYSFSFFAVKETDYYDDQKIAWHKIFDFSDFNCDGYDDLMIATEDIRGGLEYSLYIWDDYLQRHRECCGKSNLFPRVRNINCEGLKTKMVDYPFHEYITYQWVTPFCGAYSDLRRTLLIDAYTVTMDRYGNTPCLYVNYKKYNNGQYIRKKCIITSQEYVDDECLTAKEAEKQCKPIM